MTTPTDVEETLAFIYYLLAERTPEVDDA